MAAAAPITLAQERIRPMYLGNYIDGVVESRESVLIPQEAFTEVRNAFVDRGRVCRRPGHKIHSRATVPETETWTGSAGQTNTFHIIAGNAPDPGKRIELYDGPTLWAYCDKLGDDDSDPNRSTMYAATDDVAIGEYNIIGGHNLVYNLGGTGTTQVAPTADLEIRYGSTSGLYVTGIFEYADTSLSTHVIMCDEKHAYKWSEAAQEWNRIATDVFSIGTKSDLFHFAVYRDFLYMTNGRDPVHRYEPVANTVVPAPFGGAVSIDTCSLVFSAKDQLLLFNTTEAGANFGTRVRWAEPNNPESLRAVDYTEATANAEIASANFISDGFVTAFRDGTTQLLEFVGIPIGDRVVLPWAFRDVVGEYGGTGRVSSVKRGNQVFLRSRTDLVVSDGVSIQRYDPSIEVSVHRWSPSFNKEGCAVPVEEYHGFLMSYVPQGREETEEVLMVELEERPSFSFHDLHVTCFGEFTAPQTTNWDDLKLPWDAYPQAWDDFGRTGGFPQVLAGDGAVPGQVLNVFGAFGGGDRGAPFTMTVRTKRLNPDGGHVSQRLHYVDLYADELPEGEEVTFRFRRNTEQSDYLTRAVGIPRSNGNTKTWVRVHVNQVAQFHTIGIEYTGQRAWGWDLMIPWFSPAGRGRGF